MGCSVSKGEGNAIALPDKLRPLFIRRLEEITALRHGSKPLRDSTLSKKELLFKDGDEEDLASKNRLSLSDHTTSKTVAPTTRDAVNIPAKKYKDLKDPLRHEEMGVKKERGIAAGKCDKEKEVLGEDILDKKAKNSPKMRAETDSNAESVVGFEETMMDEDEQSDRERMIGHEDEEAFPGSPSFRIYFTDNGEEDDNDIGENTCFKDDNVSVKELPSKKEEKRGGKMRTFRKVLPKGGHAAVKNLLNVKNCYNSSIQSTNDRDHLLTEKTTA